VCRWFSLQASLTILDPGTGQPGDCRLDVEDLFATYRRDPKNARRTPFVAANTEALAREIMALLDL
jgi:hypothetical protein